jgi:hypothetical protein
VLKITDLASPPQGDAIMLNHDESIELAANDNRVFCFPKTWKATEFVANTEFLMAMHVSNTPDFQPNDANQLAKYPFVKDDNKRLLQLTSGDISNLGVSAIDDYLYVRFTCNSATTLKPSLWSVSSCVDKTVLITSGENIRYTKSSNIVYRMKYTDWMNYDFTVIWDNTSTMTAYMASYCNFVTTAVDLLKTIVLSRRRPSLTVTSSEVDAWMSKSLEDNYIYVRLVSTEQGNICFTSAKPAEQDPE